MKPSLRITASSPQNQAGIIVGIDYVIWLVGSVILSIYLFEGVMHELSLLGYNLNTALEQVVLNLGANINADTKLICNDAAGTSNTICASHIHVSTNN